LAVEGFLISFSPGFNRVISGNLICQYHLRKRVGQMIWDLRMWILDLTLKKRQIRNPKSQIRNRITHPLTQVVLTALSLQSETVETVRGSKGSQITRLKPGETERFGSAKLHRHP
jgi:hypothetical protein